MHFEAQNDFKLSVPWLRERSPRTHAHQVDNAILELHPNVIILNEFGYYGRCETDVAVETLPERLEAGYVIDQATCIFPTVTVTRLAFVSPWTSSQTTK
eukprot:scaffold195140_cov31-Attheya_sp.AAC.1